MFLRWFEKEGVKKLFVVWVWSDPIIEIIPYNRWKNILKKSDFYYWLHMDGITLFPL